MQAETNAQYQTVTTGTGDFTISLLPPGTYKLTVEVPGFKKFVQNGIRAAVAQTVRLDVKVQIGASDSVLVHADAQMSKRREPSKARPSIRSVCWRSRSISAAAKAGARSAIR